MDYSDTNNIYWGEETEKVLSVLQTTKDGISDEESLRRRGRFGKNTFENKEKKIDLPILIDSRMICMANSGAGKSYLVRKILEESHEKVMSIILDFEGEFKTLREKYDYLLIGHEGDVKLNMKAA